ncbi:hypothetical protein [Arsenicibacter rosenii]|uniref:hypothetical protein n=1 Tax=Arsenicibacter rosenii TaxID=1750698 RepID=UPI0008F89E63|nr:hypothetical protein [Arsenicibacter rosenii]
MGQVAQGGLNSLQISLLRMFDKGMTDDQVLELKRVLVKHYSSLLHKEVEKVVEQKQFTRDDFDAMLNVDS